MRALIISDLHCEFYPDVGRELFNGFDASDADVVIVAGDLSDFACLPDAVRLLMSMDKPVVYTFGNHECYGASISKVRERVHALATIYEDFHVLDNSTLSLMGRRFIGCPLWFPYTPNNEAYERIMGDFRYIKDYSREVYEENKISQAYLRANVRVGDIVVTHHLPSTGSIAERWRGQETNRFFLCEMTGLIMDAGPAAWIHGHTHDACDYRLGSTRVICNPSGYPGRWKGPDTGFKLETFEI